MFCAGVYYLVAVGAERYKGWSTTTDEVRCCYRCGWPRLSAAKDMNDAAIEVEMSAVIFQSSINKILNS